MSKQKQLKFFVTENDWEKEYIDMPEYNNIKQPEPAITATFKFQNETDFLKFKTKKLLTI